MRGFAKHFCAVVTCLGSLALSHAANAADDPLVPDNVSPTGKGIVGLGLLGGEAVMITEAIAGVKPGWAYAVGGGIGAAGGAVGGYFVEQGGDAKLCIYLLVGGMALALPTTVAVLSATAYEPVNYVEDRPPSDEPVADPASGAPSPTAPAGAPSSGAPSSRRTVHHSVTVAAALPKAPPALVGLDQGTLTLSVPAVEVRQTYTRTEVAMLGVKQRAEIAVPVLNVVF